MKGVELRGAFMRMAERSGGRSPVVAADRDRDHDRKRSERDGASTTAAMATPSCPKVHWGCAFYHSAGSSCQMVDVSHTHQHRPTLAKLERCDGGGWTGDGTAETAERHPEERGHDDAHGGLVAHEHYATLRVLSPCAKNDGQGARRDGK